MTPEQHLNNKQMEKVNINLADFEELQRIIHIGPVRASMIIHKRETKGRFKDRYEITKIHSLGEKRMDGIIKQGIVEV